MDLAKHNPVFHLFVWLPAALALVKQPSNVTLRCHNLHNTLGWSYEELLPGLRFRVDIYPYYGLASVLWVEPPALQADVSSFSDPDNEYLLNVTAVIGPDKSESAGGITFSYFMDSPTSQKCSVDLPPVNVTAQPDENVVFRFMHPWLSYGPRMPGSAATKLRKERSHEAQSSQHLPLFKYDVVIVSQERHPYSFNCVQSVCEKKVPVEAVQGKHCLNITGELQKIAVKSTQLYCATPLTDTPHEQTHYITYIVVGLTAVSVTAFVLFLIYKKKTSPGTALPKSISIGKYMEDTTRTVQEQIIVTKVEPSSPTPLLLHEEEEDFTPAPTPSAEPPELRLRIGVTQGDDVCDATEVGHPEDAGHGYSKGSHLDEDDTPNYEVPFGYEKREVLVEMGPGDLAEGYRA